MHHKPKTQEGWALKNPSCHKRGFCKYPISIFFKDSFLVSFFWGALFCCWGGRLCEISRAFGHTGEARSPSPWIHIWDLQQGLWDLLESFVYNCRHHHIIALDKLLWFCCCKSFQNYFGGSIGKPIWNDVTSDQPPPHMISN